MFQAGLYTSALIALFGTAVC